MRKKKNLTFGVFLVICSALLICNIDNVYAIDYVACGSATGIPKPVPQLITILYTILMVGTPIVLIVFSIITLIKAVLSDNPDNVLNLMSKIACA